MAAAASRTTSRSPTCGRTCARCAWRTARTRFTFCLSPARSCVVSGARSRAPSGAQSLLHDGGVEQRLHALRLAALEAPDVRVRDLHVVAVRRRLEVSEH